MKVCERCETRYNDSHKSCPSCRARKFHESKRAFGSVDTGADDSVKEDTRFVVNSVIEDFVLNE